MLTLLQIVLLIILCYLTCTQPFIYALIGVILFILVWEWTSMTSNMNIDSFDSIKSNTVDKVDKVNINGIDKEDIYNVIKSKNSNSIPVDPTVRISEEVEPYNLQ